MESLIVIQAINVVYGVAILALLALGLGVIFGLLGVFNIAHGEFIMLGAYTVYVMKQIGAPFLAAIPAVLALSVVLGFSIERWLIRPLYNRPFDTLVVTWGLSLLIRKTVMVVFGAGFLSVNAPVRGAIHLFGVDYPLYRLIVAAVSLILLGVTSLWYLNSRIGEQIRGMVGNPALAQAVGIDTSRLASLAFIFGTFVAMLGGVLIAPVVSIQPYLGVDYALTSFFTLVVGGLGTVSGLVSGAAVIGGVDGIFTAAADATHGYFAMLIVTIMFLWLKPRGLRG